MSTRNNPMATKLSDPGREIENLGKAAALRNRPAGGVHACGRGAGEPTAPVFGSQRPFRDKSIG